MDRECKLPQLGKVDREAGEFWVANPFMLPKFGHNLSAFEPNRVFLNHEGNGFIDVSGFSGADIDSDSRSVIVADFNRDGRSDLLIGSVGGGPLRLFENRLKSAGNRSVQIELTGTVSNRTAIGSRVTLECGDLRIVRDRFAANGFQGQSPPELLIGVGRNARIKKLTVRWPTGKTQQFTDLPTNVRIEIIEGKSKAVIHQFAAAEKTR
ncbi:MAG: CRTAC1 family protein [Planctomycetes bacterium]|nr:CRTAC1 family protein [Planctomycetota bacterium]